MGDSEGFAYKTGTVNPCFPDFAQGHCFDGWGVDGGVHGGEGGDFGWGYGFVFQAVYVDDAGGDEVVGVCDGGGGGVGHGWGSFRWGMRG